MSNINNSVTISDDTNDIEIFNPIEFMSKEDNDKLLQVVKERLKERKNPDNWLSWEKFNSLVKEKFNL